MDSRDLQRRFRAAGWPGPAEIQAYIAEAGKVEASDLERLLGILVTKGLPGDMRDQRNRCFIFTKLGEQTSDKSLFIPYVRALKSGDSQVITAVAPLIPKANSIEGHVELASLLRQPDPGLRRIVAHVCKQIGGTTVFQAVGSLCKDKDFNGRMEAMDIMVSIGRQHAIPALTLIIQLGNPAEKGVALQYLGNADVMQKDLSGAVKAIALILRDDNEKLLVSAISAFGMLASEDDYLQHVSIFFDAGNQGLVRAAVDGIKRYRSPRVIEILERKMREGPNAIRISVLATLETIATDDVIPLVVNALNYKKIDVRQRAGEVLTNLALAGKVDIARTILWLLRSRDVNVRRMAVDIAKRVGDPSGELAPKLLRYLRDEDWWVRERVMDALVEMAGRQLTRHLVGYLQDPSDVVRRYAVDALERVKDPASLGALVRSAQSDTDWWVRERATQVVGKLGDPRAVPYVIDIMTKEPDMQRACVEALASLKAKEMAPRIASLLEAADIDMRLVILDALGQLDDGSQADAVVAVSHDDDYRVRTAARDLLKKWNAAAQAAAAPPKTLSLLDRLLMALAQNEGDDLILAGGNRPYMKKIGKVMPLAQHVFTPDQVKGMLLPCLNPKGIADLAVLKDVDFSYDIKSEALRFRANIFQQMPGISAVFRIVKDKVPLLEDLGVPAIVKTFGEMKNGLVLVGGPTGSGKSTTLAGIIDHINRTTSRHIITLEDPIEVVHKQKKCLVNQRELGTHTRSFESALRSTLREDPDVILVGEMRDVDTIQFAVTAAETGHLVLGTLHTVSVDTSVSRLINSFPAGQQPQVRALLADTLRAVMCQYLLKKKDGTGRVLALEIMMNNDAIANMIRKEKTFQIPSVIATSRDSGMQSMDSDLERLYRLGAISADDAYMKAANKKNFEVILGMTTGDGKPFETKGPMASPGGGGTSSAGHAHSPIGTSAS